MALTNEEKQKIQEEEKLRAEARAKYSKPLVVEIKKRHSRILIAGAVIIIPFAVWILVLMTNPKQQVPVHQLSAQEKQEVVTYFKKLEPILNLMYKIVADIDSVSVGQSASKLTTYQKQLEASRTKLYAIEPPVAVKHAHQLITEVFNDLTNALDLGAEGIRNQNQKTIDSANWLINDATTRINKAQAELQSYLNQ